MTKVYLAGQSSNAHYIERLAAELAPKKYARHKIQFTEKWWEVVLNSRWTNSQIVSPLEIAARDVQGIDDADTVLALLDARHGDGRGMWYELGYAAAQGKPTYLCVTAPTRQDLWDLQSRLVFAQLTTDTLWLHRTDLLQKLGDEADWFNEVVRCYASVAHIRKASVKPEYPQPKPKSPANGWWRIGDYLARQKEWSAEVSGSADRTEGCLKHIEAEIAEVRQAKAKGDADGVREELCDIIILAMDVLWRNNVTAEEMIAQLERKQQKNLARKWPKMPPDQPSMHVKEDEDESDA